MATSFFKPVPAWDMAKAREFLDQHSLDQYTLLDVRQPEEYASGHLPGATSIPLDQLPQRLGELDRDKPLLAYCRSGGRAGNAVALLHQSGLSSAVNIGGTMQYDGLVATGPPEAGMAWFDQARSPAEYVALAWLLERGAHQFYRELAGREPAARELFETLAQGEERHQATLERQHRQLTGSDDPPALPEVDEDMMEGGVSKTAALQWLADKGVVEMYDLAAAMEANAHDRYIRVGQGLGGQTQQIFVELAEAEKVHMRQLLEALRGALG